MQLWDGIYLGAPLCPFGHLGQMSFTAKLPASSKDHQMGQGCEETETIPIPMRIAQIVGTCKLTSGVSTWELRCQGTVQEGTLQGCLGGLRTRGYMEALCPEWKQGV